MNLTEGAMHMIAAFLLLNQRLTVLCRTLLHIVPPALDVVLDGELVIRTELNLLFARPSNVRRIGTG